jgi:acyl-CoA reductase-like NAD-dependent aldehyde dehydrogenase
VVGLITPWNFPFLIVSQKLPFALAAGCTAVLKPSEFTSGTALRLGRFLEEEGLPPGVVNIVTGYGEPVGRILAEDARVDMLSFTGSTGVGKEIVAASRGNLKKVALELGGKNPQLIFPDADLEAAKEAAVFGALFNMGECCNSGSRLLVHEDVPETFVTELAERVGRVKVGDPLDETTQVGAIINGKQHEKIRELIEAGRREGATLVTGGGDCSRDGGRFLEPTIFTGVRPEMRIAREEIFGPVLSVLRFRTAEEAVRLANEVAYGLSASVWSRNVETALNAVRGIRAGTVWVNTFLDGFPELPFGGYRESGLGRELGRNAVEEFTESKTVTMRLRPAAPAWD